VLFDHDNNTRQSQAAKMWPNNGFGSNGQFQNNFNNQDDYSPASFGTGVGPSGPGQYFPQQPHNPAMIQYDENGNVIGDFEPEVGLYNEGPFFHNQFLSPQNPQVRVVQD
jgi:YTH domain-containing protein 1